MRCSHKRYFLEYESDKICMGSNNHTWGNANSIKTCKQYIAKARKEFSELNPRNFRIYDSDTEAVFDPEKGCEFVSCAYSEA